MGELARRARNPVLARCRGRGARCCCRACRGRTPFVPFARNSHATRTLAQGANFRRRGLAVSDVDRQRAASSTQPEAGHQVSGGHGCQAVVAEYEASLLGRAGPNLRSPVSIKARARFGKCAMKASNLPRKICIVSARTEPQGFLTAVQKSAEVPVDAVIRPGVPPRGQELQREPAERRVEVEPQRSLCMLGGKLVQTAKRWT